MLQQEPLHFAQSYNHHCQDKKKSQIVEMITVAKLSAQGCRRCRQVLEVPHLTTCPRYHDRRRGRSDVDAGHARSR